MNSLTAATLEVRSELPGRRSGVVGLAILLAACAPVVLDGLVPPWGIPSAMAAIWLVLRLQGQSLSAVGVRRPPIGWPRTILLGLGGAVLMLALGQYVYPFLKELIGVGPQDISSYEVIEGNHAMLAIFLIVSWTTAGFGEEFIFRGFLMSGLARLLGQSRAAWAASLFLVSVTFGLLHFRTGVGGVLSTGMNGAVLAGLFLASRRTIWSVYIAHGLADTVAFLMIYTGNY